MPKVLTFEKAMQKANALKGPKGGSLRKHLLLGNGFSIALKPDIFTYASLFKKANFSKHPEIAQVFDHLDTHDFEEVIFGLESAASVLSCYLAESEAIQRKMHSDAQAIKEILVKTIAGNHPPRPNDVDEKKLISCANFLKGFLDSEGKIYTLNYDLLLYWVLMHNKDIFSKIVDDGFRTDEDDPQAEWVIWNDGDSPRQNVYYLHGALHLFDAGHQLHKYTWNRTDVPLIDQARAAIAADKFPMFVSESSSEKKLTKIEHSGYLHKGLRSLRSIQGSLFIYGLSLSDNDEHIVESIERGKIAHVFIGLYGDPDTDTNKRIVSRANKMTRSRAKGSLQAHFFDSQSAKVWG